VSVLAKLLPRKTDFFALFSRHAALTVEAAHALLAMLDRLGDAEAESGRIRGLEHQADAICQETMETLHRTFVTPIDRADVHSLASRLDDIMDHVSRRRSGSGSTRSARRPPRCGRWRCTCAAPPRP